MIDEKDLVVCTRGHVTDPYADVDTATGNVLGPSDMLTKRGGRPVPPGMIERGSLQFTEICRAVEHRGSQRAAHRCGGPVRHMNDVETAAYRLGGPVAVRAMYQESL